MGNYLSGMIVGFREGLEAFLIIVIMLRFLRKVNQVHFIKDVKYGTAFGVIVSLLAGGALYTISNMFGKVEETAKLWESGASILALALITTFIFWMMKQGSNMVGKVESDTAKNLSRGGIILISATMIAREGVEIAIFSFAGEYHLLSIFFGIFLSLILTVLIYFSLVKISLKTIFNLTLLYLILQAGFLLGYGIHEGLSALKEMGHLSQDSLLFQKAFNLSGGILDHKTGLLGLPLYVLFGWYSKPELIQFFTQYSYTFLMLWLWMKSKRVQSLKG